MTTLALLLVCPLLWPIVAKLLWRHEITLPELGLNILIGVLVVVGGWAAGRYSQMTDTQIINGQLLSKASEQVSCEHSYSCNCSESCSGSGSSRSCSTTCSTCFEHSYDLDWLLKSDVGTIKVDRISRRGLEEPPRFTRAVIGEPVAQRDRFSNYIKAAPDSLFSAAADSRALSKFAERVPAYPDSVYDYHHVDRVLPVGLQVPDLTDWNKTLATSLRTLGPLKQANIVMVLANESDPEFANAVRAKWLGGKKNDVVVVLGTPQYPAIAWARVISWTDRELFKVQLRDALVGLKTASPTAVMDLVGASIRKDFVRRPMKDFEYLEWQIEPPSWAIALLGVLSILASVGLSVYFSRNQYHAGGRYGYR